MEYDAVGGILGIENTYESNFNYRAYEVSNENMETLMRFEQDLRSHQKKTMDSMFSMAKILYKAREILSNNKTGTFGAWHENLGFNREAVSVLLKRYDLYLELKDKKVMSLPVRAVKEITKDKSHFSKVQIEEIIKSENPMEKIKYIVRQSDNIMSDTDIEEAQIVESEEERTKRIKKEIRLLRQEANELIEKAKYLKEQADELEKTL